MILWQSTTDLQYIDIMHHNVINCNEFLPVVSTDIKNKFLQFLATNWEDIIKEAVVLIIIEVEVKYPEIVVAGKGAHI